MAADTCDAETLLRAMFGAGDHLWSAGTLAAFMALPAGGTVRDEAGGAVLSAEGCLARLRPRGARLLAFETLSSDPRGWNHGIALCLPAGPVPSSGGVLRATVDDDPVRPADRARPALDLGLGQGVSRVLFCPREGPELAGMKLAGMPWEDAAPLLEQAPGTWIIDTPVLRVERPTQAGPGLHSVAQALATGRTHAETTPLPPGLVPVAHVFPPHPARRRPGEPMDFDAARHARFQAILARHGRADLWALKADIIRQLAAGRFDPPETDRHGAIVVRVALRQHLHLHGAPPPRPWLERFDRPLLRRLEGGEG